LRTMPNGFVRFTVRDSGIGIPSKAYNKIFKEFSQVDASTTKKFGGTGLGLSICKQISDVLGGEIDFSSIEGEGSSFFMTIPLSNLETKAIKKKASISKEGAGVDTKSLRIILVDDSEDNRLVVKLFCRDYPYTIETCENGQEVYDLFTKSKSRTYDLILMDLQMPVIDGYSATKMIRKYEREQGLAPIYITALSASVLENEVQRALDVGCDDYLGKPIKKSILLDHLSTVSSSVSQGVYICWDESYSVGNEIIDQQHQDLFTLINDLHKTFGKKDSESGLETVIKHLFDYIDFHFETEEEIFLASDYPGTKEHIARHQKFKNRLLEFEEQFKNGKLDKVDLFNFVKTWLSSHIKKTDFEYQFFI